MKRFLIVVTCLMLLTGMVPAQTVLGPTTIVLLGIGHYTGATLQTNFPAATWAWYSAWVTDGPLCTGGGLGPEVLCYSNGITWKPLSSGGGAGTGWGNVVPNEFTTIQAAINSGGGPVIVLPSSTDNTTYTNPTSMTIRNYKPDGAGQTGVFFRDVSEWGKVDGKVIPSCTMTAGSNAATCSVTFINSPVSAGGDVGKLILIDGLGPQTGQVSGTMTVASTAGVTVPGTPNTLQGVIFTDATDGCNTIDTMPYAYVNLNASGMPTGNLRWTTNFYGKGCTHPPTSGTVQTVTGTVTFSGGSMVYGDLVSSITGVTGTNAITLADNAIVSGSGSALYGSDIHDTFQAACNGISQGGFLTSGVLTFSGIGLTSRGIDCNSAGLHILGRGYDAVDTHGSGSTLVYAGKTRNSGAGSNNSSAFAYVLNLSQGGGEKVERIGIRGNSQALPYAIMTTFGGTGVGNWTNPQGVIDQAWLGWQWGDGYGSVASVPRLQSCVFANGQTGNDDFWSFDHIYCYGADIGMDSLNDQSVNYHIGTWQSEFSNIGFTCVSYCTVKDYYTEFNRVDMYPGSPIWVNAGFPGYMKIEAYGGESSAMEFEGSSWESAYNVEIQGGGGLGGSTAYNRPDGITSDYSSFIAGSITVHAFPRGKVNIPVNCEGAAGTYAGWNFDIYAWQFQINYIQTGSNCGQLFANFAAGGQLRVRNPLGPYNLSMDLLATPTTALNLTTPGTMPQTMLAMNRSQIHVGSLHVTSPAWAPPGVNGYGFNQGARGATGTTTYNYDVTCTDSLGNEITVQPINSVTSAVHFTITNGTTPLTATNYNYISIWPREGCPIYNLYGDNGIGGVIGYLTSLGVEQMSSETGLNAPNLSFHDTGQWTKNTSRTAPTVSKSGSVVIDGNLNVGGLTSLQNVNIAGTCTGSGCGSAGGGLADPGANGIIKRTALNVTAPAVGGTDYLRPSDVMADPGANGIMKRTAFNVTAPAVGGTDYLRPSDVSAAPGIGFLYQINTATPAGLSNIAPSGAKCYPFAGTGGTGCDTPATGPTTRTWRFDYAGVCNGGTSGAPINLPSTGSAPTFVPCSTVNNTGEWTMPAGSITSSFYIKVSNLPGGMTGSWTIYQTFRSVDNTHTATGQLQYACIAAGGSPDSIAWTNLGATFTLTPNATSNRQANQTLTQSPTCAAGSDLYINWTLTANALTSPLNFSYVGAAVQAGP